MVYFTSLDRIELCTVFCSITFPIGWENAHKLRRATNERNDTVFLVGMAIILVLNNKNSEFKTYKDC